MSNPVLRRPPWQQDESASAEEVGVAAVQVQMVNTSEGVNPDHLAWVMALLRVGSSLPRDALERTAGALCRSLRPSTLGDYFRFTKVCERLMGAPFASWAALSEE